MHPIITCISLLCTPLNRVTCKQTHIPMMYTHHIPTAIHQHHPKVAQNLKFLLTALAATGGASKAAVGICNGESADRTNAFWPTARCKLVAIKHNLLKLL